MDANTLRRLNLLWKHRHTHTGDELDDIERRLIIVESNVDQDQANSVGAYIHLADATGQEISDGGEAVTFTSILKTPLNFTATTPTDEVLIRVPGYYDFSVDVEWDTYRGGGAVWVERTRSGDTKIVWPVFTGSWTSPGGSRFTGNVPAIECFAGDVVALWVDANSGQAEDLKRAVFVPRLLDRRAVLTPAPTGSGTPDVEAVAHAISIADTSSYPVPLPDSQADDLLVMIVSGGDAGTAVSGWTKLASDSFTLGGVARWATVLWKKATGSEGTSATLSFSGNAGYAMAAIRFREPTIDWAEDPPTVTSLEWTTDPVMDVPTAVPAHGNGNYWVLPFAATNEHGAFVEGSAGYPQIAYADHVHAWERIWVGAALEDVTDSVTPGDIAFAGGGGAHTGVVLVKGG